MIYNNLGVNRGINKENTYISTGTGIILNDDFSQFFSSRHKYEIDITRDAVEEYISKQPMINI